MQFEVWLFN